MDNILSGRRKFMSLSVSPSLTLDGRVRRKQETRFGGLEGAKTENAKFAKSVRRLSQAD